MGRIKTGLVKKTSKQLLEKTPDSFNKEFGHNKRALGNTLPSKRMRNKVAGYVTRLKRNTKKILNDQEVSDNE